VQHADQQTCRVAVTNRGPLPQLGGCGLVSSPIQQLHQVVCAGLVTVIGAFPQFCDLLHAAALVQNLDQPCRRIDVAVIGSGPQFGYRIGIARPGQQFDQQGCGVWLAAVGADPKLADGFPATVVEQEIGQSARRGDVTVIGAITQPRFGLGIAPLEMQLDQPPRSDLIACLCPGPQQFHSRRITSFGQ
jgi:hypothetical protein